MNNLKFEVVLVRALIPEGCVILIYKDDQRLLERERSESVFNEVPCRYRG